jgi:NADPH:quinone reductase-like Zn-dependent oxidoreductase
MTNFLSRPKAVDLTALKDLIEADKIKPLIGSRFPLGEVPAAIAQVGGGHGRGKVVITI